jgi:hypothetical protein
MKKHIKLYGALALIAGAGVAALTLAVLDPSHYPDAVPVLKQNGIMNAKIGKDPHWSSQDGRNETAFLEAADIDFAREAIPPVDTGSSRTVPPPWEIRRILQDGDEKELSDLADAIGLEESWDTYKFWKSDPLTTGSMIIDGLAANESVIQVGCSKLNGWYLFMFLNEEKEAWRCLDLLDIKSNWFDPVLGLTTLDDRQRWIRVSYKYGYGTGCGAFATDWYELTADGIDRVLTHPGGGHNLNGICNLKVGCPGPLMVVERGVPTVCVKYNVKYSAQEGRNYFTLFETVRKALFRQVEPGRPFLLVERPGFMSRTELDGIMGVSMTKWLSFYFEELAHAAMEGSPSHKYWIHSRVAPEYWKTPERPAEANRIYELLIRNLSREDLEYFEQRG